MSNGQLDYAEFLPPIGAPAPTAGPPAPAGHAARTKPGPITTNDAVRLCNYAHNRILHLRGEWHDQRDKWVPFFNVVFEAYKRAHDAKVKTLEAAEREFQQEAEQRAAITSFVFSILTAGAARYVGGFIQYRYLPRSFKGSKLLPNPARKNEWTEQFEYPRERAAFFGGSTSDIIKTATGVLAPKGKSAVVPKETQDIGLMHSEFINDDVQATVTAVAEALLSVAVKINATTDFGERWLNFTNGNYAAAHQLVAQKMQGYRERWAASSDLFGRNPPKSPNSETIGRQYERGLWAAYIMDADDTTDYEEVYTGEFSSDTRVWLVNPLAKAVTTQLQQLNVVLPDKAPKRIPEPLPEGDSRPTVRARDKIDDPEELKALKDWAGHFLSTAPKDTAARFFPKAEKRDLTLTGE